MSCIHLIVNREENKITHICALKKLAKDTNRGVAQLLERHKQAGFEDEDIRGIICVPLEKHNITGCPDFKLKSV